MRAERTNPPEFPIGFDFTIYYDKEILRKTDSTLVHTSVNYVLNSPS